jgi:hypothetical protein
MAFCSRGLTSYDARLQQINTLRLVVRNPAKVMGSSSVQWYDIVSLQVFTD